MSVTAADVSITQYNGIIVYRSNREYLWPAVAIMTATILSTSSLLLGFWQLDREVTLSPLETALAIRNGLNHPNATHMEGDKLVEDNKPVEADKLVRDNRRRKIQLVKRNGKGETADSGVTHGAEAGRAKGEQKGSSTVAASRGSPARTGPASQITSAPRQ